MVNLFILDSIILVVIAKNRFIGQKPSKTGESTHFFIVFCWFKPFINQNIKFLATVTTIFEFLMKKFTI